MAATEEMNTLVGSEQTRSLAFAYVQDQNVTRMLPCSEQRLMLSAYDKADPVISTDMVTRAAAYQQPLFMEFVPHANS